MKLKQNRQLSCFTGRERVSRKINFSWLWFQECIHLKEINNVNICLKIDTNLVFLRWHCFITSTISLYFKNFPTTSWFLWTFEINLICLSNMDWFTGIIIICKDSSPICEVELAHTCITAIFLNWKINVTLSRFWIQRFHNLSMTRG